jgi:hypothetical protein
VADTLPQWLTLVNAAKVLDEPVESLRKKIERRAVVRDGRIESTLDGLQCRKLGGRWKVRLGCWGGAA